MSDITKHVEPEAAKNASSLDILARLSIAISLKRIADMMEAEGKKPKPSIFEQTFGR